MLIRPIAKETLTVSSTALPLAAPPANGAANCAVITVETDQVRFWVDGSTPTASVGHLLNVGDELELRGGDELTKFRVIRVTADATLQVTYGVHLGD